MAGPAPGASAPLPRPVEVHGGPQEHPEILLKGVAIPSLEFHRPARTDGVTLLTVPGGGYEVLAVRNEGSDVARVFTALPGAHAGAARHAPWIA